MLLHSNVAWQHACQCEIWLWQLACFTGFVELQHNEVRFFAESQWWREHSSRHQQDMVEPSRRHP